MNGSLHIANGRFARYTNLVFSTVKLTTFERIKILAQIFCQGNYFVCAALVARAFAPAMASS
jgi:hypothetical protein